MTHRRGWCAAALGLALAACEADLALDAVLQGKACRRGEPPECLEGYVCLDEVCVSASTIQTLESPEGGGGVLGALDAGASPGAAGGGAPDGAAGIGAGPSSGTPGGATPGGATPGGATPGGGAPSGASAAGAGGAPGGGAAPDPMSPASEGPDASPPSAGCSSPGFVFRDRDGDGYGSSAEEDRRWGCPGPGWVTLGNDCLDAPPAQLPVAVDVHPGQTRFFEKGYPDPSRPLSISFDYDCSEAEDADPGNLPSLAADGCGVSSLACAPDGFRPLERAGTGIHRLCGSEIVVVCEPYGLQCAALEIRTDQPFRCR